MLFSVMQSSPAGTYPLSLHDALPISAAYVREAHDVIAVIVHLRRGRQAKGPLFSQEQEPVVPRGRIDGRAALAPVGHELIEDRKSTRLNSSHTVISYAVFCLKKKTSS